MVFINQDTGYLMIDIVNAFVAKGYDCVLITGRVVERKILLDKNVKIDSIVRYNRETIPKRVFSWTMGFMQIWFKVLFTYRKDELIIVTNPPLAPLLPLFCRNKYYQLIFDLDIVRVLDLGFVKKTKILSLLWKKAIKKALGGAEFVFTLTKGMAEMLQPFVENKEVVIMPLWTDNSEFRMIHKSDNSFVKKHHLENKFIVMYSGNLGASSGVEPIIEVANNVTNENIIFLIIGEGLRKEALIKKRDEYKLKNCIFLPWQDPSVLPFSLAAADLAVVSLVGTESKRSIPSKIFNNMSVGNPILGIASKESDLADIIEKLNIGQIFEANEIKEIINFIDALSTTKEMHRQYRFNSSAASEKFTSLNTNIILDRIQPK
ncbi:MAG: glycosyltransferase family 4 protein [Crocinitomicaceae bacterium]|nr:glycosyltransferase family 4 protein [Crocinitomicaceae bacterium]